MEIIRSMDSDTTLLSQCSSEFPLMGRGEAGVNLLSLPNEILKVILEYLDAKSRMEFTSTCWRIWRLKGELSYCGSSENEAKDRSEMLVHMKLFTEKVGRGPSKLRLVNPSSEMVNYVSQHWTSLRELVFIDNITSGWWECAPEYRGNLSFLRSLTRLRELSITFNLEKDTYSLTPLAHLQELKKLTLVGLRSMRFSLDLCPLRGLKVLRELCLFGMESLRDVREVVNLTSLRSLSIQNCHRLTEVSPLLQARWLEHLSIVGAGMLGDEGVICSMVGLKSLVFACWGIEGGMPGITWSTSLRKLGLISNKKGYSYSSRSWPEVESKLHLISHLEKLTISLWTFNRLPSLKLPSSVRTLSVPGMSCQDVDLSKLEGMSSLEVLKLGEYNVVHLESLHSMRLLRKVVLSGTGISLLQLPMQPLRLEHLVLDGNFRPNRVKQMCKLFDVKVLEIVNNENITDVMDLPPMFRLERLGISKYPNFRHYSGDEMKVHLPSLRMVSMDSKVEYL